MSSQTPNLNLVLPVGTEHVSRQIINDNNTKIDTAVGSNSSAITNLQSDVATHSVSTMSEFIALFTTNDKVLRVRISGTLSSSLIDEANRNALLFAWINAGWIYYFAEDYEGVFGSGYMNASTQQVTYKKLATKSDIAGTQLSVTPIPISGVSYQYASVIRSGNVITAQFRIDFASKPSGYVTVYSGLPHPLTSIYKGIINLDATIGGLVAVDISGNILVNPNAAGTFFIQITYIC